MVNSAMAASGLHGKRLKERGRGKRRARERERRFPFPLLTPATQASHIQVRLG